MVDFFTHVDPTAWVLLVVAGINAPTWFIAGMTLWYAHKTAVVAGKTEINTNSMREALVVATAVASKAEGRDEMRIEAAITAAAVAQGVAQAQPADRPK